MASSSRRASAEAPPPNTTATPESSHAPDTTIPTADPSLEMTDLPPQHSEQSPPPPAAAAAPATATTTTASAATPSIPPSQSQEALAGAAAPSSSNAPEPTTPTPPLKRAETEAIGPATEAPAAKPDSTSGPVVVITLLLTSGARHPYKIDEKYLKKRGVKVDKMDPFNITVYMLKELILRDWREEWDPAPSSPSYIRLIHFGRMLDDKQALKDCRFQPESPNVVHMTVKPQEVIDEEDAKTAKTGSGRDRDGEERTAGCRCVIL